jgi:hypothetical protein
MNGDIGWLGHAVVARMKRRKAPRNPGINAAADEFPAVILKEAAAWFEGSRRPEVAARSAALEGRLTT